jgi:hypothetical protein
VNLSRPGEEKKDFLVSRLVAATFMPNPENLPEVNHKDEDKHNNWDWNLEWCTRKYNHDYGMALEKQVKATDYSKIAEKKRKPVKATKIGTSEVFTFPSMGEARRQGFGFETHISQCCLGKAKSYHGYAWQYATQQEAG